jgi:hypothetical protein
MPKCSLLITSCFLFGSTLTAGPIDLTITFFQASARDHGDTSFIGSGPSFTIGGSQTPTPLGPIGFGFGFGFGYPASGERHIGFATITGGPQTDLELIGGFSVFGTGPGLGEARGQFGVLDCGFNFGAFPNCPQIANIAFDLPGDVALGYYQNSAGGVSLGSATFTSVSTPEPSSMLLLLLGVMAIGMGLTGSQINWAVR